MKKIILTKGNFCIVDNEDYKKYSKYKWHSDVHGYALRGIWNHGKRIKVIRLHREIINAPNDLWVDHINHNKRDNRKKNLRLVNASQNIWNSHGQNNSSSRFKGVYWKKQNSVWAAQIKCKGKTFHIGYFKKEKQAALAYNDYAKEKFGKYAFLNEVKS